MAARRPCKANFHPNITIFRSQSQHEGMKPPQYWIYYVFLTWFSVSCLHSINCSTHPSNSFIDSFSELILDLALSSSCPEIANLSEKSPKAQDSHNLLHSQYSDFSLTRCGSGWQGGEVALQLLEPRSAHAHTQLGSAHAHTLQKCRTWRACSHSLIARRRMRNDYHPSALAPHSEWASAIRM